MERDDEGLNEYEEELSGEGSDPSPEGGSERLVPESSPTPEGMAVAVRIWDAVVKWQDGRIWTLLLGRMMTAIGFSLFFPFLSIYLHLERGVEMKVVGLIFLLGGIAGATAKVQGGVLADRLGRRKVMAMALLLRGLAILGLAQLTAIEADVFWIAALVVVSSYTGHFFIPAAQAMIADITTGEKRLEGYGLFRVATNLGWAIGPLLGGAFPPSAYPVLLLITGSLYLLTTALLFFTLHETAPKPAGGPVRLSDLALLTEHRSFLAFGVVIVLIYTVMGQMMSNLSTFTVEFVGLQNWHVGRLFALNGFIVIILQIPLARVIRASAARMTTALFFGSLLYAAGYYWVGFAPSFLHLALPMVVITFGEMVVQPTGLALASNLAPPHQRGRFLGVFGLFNHLGWSLGPFLGGVGLDYFADRPPVTWVFVSALALLAAVGCILIRPILPAEADQPVRAALRE